jgi:3-phenylpropionate/cinnamic acid dioxygenase small subunit
MLTAEQRLDVQEFYARYAECIDGGRLQHWADFFTEPCLYRVTTRRGLRLGGDEDWMNLDSTSLLRDRVVSMGQSEDFEPYQLRHFFSNFRIQEAEGDELHVHANFLVLRTYAGRASEVLAAGYCQDRVGRPGGRMKFRQKLYVAESGVRPESFVYPI